MENFLTGFVTHYMVKAVQKWDCVATYDLASLNVGDICLVLLRIRKRNSQLRLWKFLQQRQGCSIVLVTLKGTVEVAFLCVSQIYLALVVRQI